MTDPPRVHQEHRFLTTAAICRAGLPFTWPTPSSPEREPVVEDAGWPRSPRIRHPISTGRPLLVEFWTHASLQEPLRARVTAAHEELLDGYAAILTELTAQDGLTFVVPAKELARSTAAFARGLALERLLNEAVTQTRLEELFSAHADDVR